MFIIFIVIVYLCRIDQSEDDFLSMLPLQLRMKILMKIISKVMKYRTVLKVVAATSLLMKMIMIPITLKVVAIRTF